MRSTQTVQSLRPLLHRQRLGQQGKHRNILWSFVLCILFLCTLSVHAEKSSSSSKFIPDIFLAIPENVPVPKANSFLGQDAIPLEMVNREETAISKPSALKSEATLIPKSTIVENSLTKAIHSSLDEHININEEIEPLMANMVTIEPSMETTMEPTDIGGDIPVLSYFIHDIGSSSIRIAFNISTEGTIFSALYLSSETQPENVEVIKAQGVVATNVRNVPYITYSVLYDNLIAETDYTIYFVPTSVGGSSPNFDIIQNSLAFQFTTACCRVVQVQAVRPSFLIDDMNNVASNLINFQAEASTEEENVITLKVFKLATTDGTFTVLAELLPNSAIVPNTITIPQTTSRFREITSGSAKLNVTSPGFYAVIARADPESLFYTRNYSGGFNGISDEHLIIHVEQRAPTAVPTAIPSAAPTAVPTAVPTAIPTAAPTAAPTATPSATPTAVPTVTPTALPTAAPTAAPTAKPTAVPTAAPTAAPSATSQPTLVPGPTAAPTFAPSFSVEQTWINYYNLLVDSLDEDVGIDGTYATSSIYSSLTAIPGARDVIGTCDAWVNYVFNDVGLTRLNYAVAAVGFLEINTLPTNTGINVLSPKTCSNQTAANAILNKLSEMENLGSSKISGPVICGENRWLVASCANGNEFHSAICVNCVDPCAAKTNVISPCGSANVPTSGDYVLRAMSVLYRPLPGSPQFVGSIEPTTTTDSISGIIRLNAPGSVYIGIYRDTAKIPTSTSSIILQNNNAEYLGNNEFSFSIGGLIPSTRYILYAVPISETGIRASMAYVVGNRVFIGTRCCKTITFSLSTSNLITGVDVSGFLTVQINGLPSSNLQLIPTVRRQQQELIAIDISEYQENVIENAFIPAVAQVPLENINISTSTATLTFSLSRIAQPGIYRINVNLQGEVGDAYSYKYPAMTSLGKGLAFQVFSDDDPLPAPLIQSATFNADGSSVAVLFDRPTDMGTLGTKFNCNSMFQFTCASASTCGWINPTTVIALIASDDACLRPGDMLRLAPSFKLRAKCLKASGECSTHSTWPITDTSTAVVPVNVGAVVSSPTVVVSIPSQIGACSPLIFDISSSSGSGGRSWSNISISVQSEDSAGVRQNSTGLEMFLKYNFAISPPVVIPASYFVSGNFYAFGVKLCNFLGKCSTTSRRIAVLSTLLPVVTIPGSGLRSISRNSALSVSSSAFVPSCGEAQGSSNSLSYSWSVSIGTSVQTGIVSTSKDVSRFVLPAFSLASNTLYQVAVRVSMKTGGSVSTSLQVFIQPGALVASISGSRFRSMYVGESTTLDGSQSFDEDQRGKRGTEAGLSYSWSCIQVEPVLNSTCRSIFSATQTTFQTWTLTALDQGESDESFVGEVTMTVSDQSGRSSSTKARVAIISSSSPLITVVTNMETAKLNTEDSLKLTATVVIPASINGNASWSLDAGSRGLLDLAKVSLTPVNLSLRKGVTSARTVQANRITPQSYTLYLALPPNVLLGGINYGFVLSISLDPPGKSLSTSITIPVNLPPTPGSYRVNKLSGVELKDSFTFACSRWIDEELPLTYVFGYKSISDSDVNLRSRNELSYTSSVLPAGASSVGNNVTTFAVVYDSLSASSYSTFIVKVTEMVVQMSSNDVLSYISGMGEAENVDEAKKSSAIGNYLLNRVECKLAPNCKSLNRKKCTRTKNTCGKCLGNAYSGDAGDANTMCTKKKDDGDDENSRRMLSSETIATLATTSPKSCPDSCSGHGTCTYISIITDAPVATCANTDLSCIAVCKCNTGYAGTATCSLSDSELATKQEARKQVIALQYNIMKQEDLSRETVVGWINSLVEASLSPGELSAQTLDIFLELVTMIIHGAKEIGLSNEDLSSYMDILEAVLQAKQLASKSRTTRMLATSSAGDNVLNTTQYALQQYTNLLASNMVPSQAPVTDIKSGFRLLVAKFVSEFTDSTAGCTANITTGMPLTANEKDVGVTATEVNIPQCSSVEREFSFSSIMFSKDQYSGFNNSNGATLNSDSLQVTFSSFPCLKFPCNMDMVLQRSYDETANDASSTATKFTLNCFKNVISEKAYTCPDKTPVLLKCDGVVEGVATATCPYIAPQEECNKITASQSSDDVGCMVLDSTLTTVTCRCPVYGVNKPKPVVNNPNARRALAAASIPTGAISVTFASVIHPVKQGLTYTVKPGTMNRVVEFFNENPWQVFSTIGILFFFTIVFFCYGYYRDGQDQKVGRQQVIQNHISFLSSAFTAGGKRSKTQIQLQHQLNQHKKTELQDVMLLSERSLPRIFNHKLTFLERVRMELLLEHRWLSVIFLYHEQCSRLYRMISLFTNLMMVCFVLALTFNYTKSSHHSDCHKHSTEQDCNAHQDSTYDSHDQQCYWDLGQASCRYHPVDVDFRVILFCTIFASIVTTPFTYLIDYLVTQYLAAPTKLSSMSSGSKKERYMLEVENAASADDKLVVGNKKQNVAKLGADEEEGGDISNFYSSSEGIENYASNTHEDQVRQHHQQYSMSTAANKYLYHNKEELKGKVDTAFKQLKDELEDFRYHLHSDERVKFDECWGLDSHGKFASFHPHGKLTMMCMSREQMNNTYNVKSDLSDVIVRIQTELFKATSYTHINATASNKPLTTGNNSEVAISQKLMYLFQYDLLPPVTSRILDTKHNRDILHLTPVHALTQQCILMALLLFNAGMLGYVLYFGADARFYLQSAWARSFALYLFIDVIFTSTIFVCFFHMLLPLCISQDIYDMKTKLTTLIHQFNSNYAASRQVQPTNSTSSNSIKALPKFNASNYFFISKFIAKEYLNLHVSKFILHYATEFPRRASYQHNEENDVQTMYKLSIEAFIGFLNLPLWIQNTFIHLSCMFLIAVTIYYNVLIYEIQAEVIVISIFVYLVMIHFFYSACKSRQHMYQKAIGEKISNTENLLLMIDDVETPKPAAVLNAADALIAASATETVLGIAVPPEEEIKPVFAVYSDSEKLLTPKLKSKPKSGLLGSGSNGVDGSALEKQSSLDGIPNMQLFAKPSRDDYEGDAPTATQAASDFGIFSNTIQRMVSRQTMPSNKIVSMAESPVVTRKGVVIISPRQDDDDRFGFASKTIDIDRADELEIEIDYGEDPMEQDDDVVDRPVEDEEDDEHMHETHPMEDDAEEANTSLPTQFNYDKTQIKSFVQQARSRPVTPHERGLESKSSKAFFTDSKGVLGSRPASARPVSMNSAKADEDYNYQSDAVHDEDEEYQQIVYSQQLERSTSFERYRDEDEEFDVIAHPDQHHHHEQHHDQDNNEDDDDQSISSHAAGLHTLATEEYEPHSPTKVRDPHVLKTKGSKQRKL